MRERPILFSAPMVQALLAGTKTQTRRVVKITHRTPGLAACLEPADPAWVRTKPAAELCPYGKPGDRLWVRETFVIGYPGAGNTYSAIPWTGADPQKDGKVFYRADGDDPKDGPQRPWTSSIHMPRWASRITLEVTDVRVERLQEISEEDAIAEGCSPFSFGTWWQGYRDDGGDLFHQTCRGETPPDWMIEPKPMKATPHLDRTARDAYRLLWESINGAGSWEANQWVWVIRFKRVP